MEFPSPVPDELVELIACRFRLLSEAMRIRLFDRLRHGEATVHQLADELGSSQQNVSKHLADADVLALCEQVCGSVERHLLDLAALVAPPGAAQRTELSMSKNMTVLDRRLGTVLIAPVAVLMGVLIGLGSVASIVLYALAAVMLATSSAGYCPLYFPVRDGWPPPEPRRTNAIAKGVIRNGCDNRDLRTGRDRTLARAAGGGRFLGRLVLPVPDARPGA